MDVKPLTVTCGNCGKETEVDRSTLSYDLVDSVERQMGAEKTFRAELKIKCKNCGHTIEVEHLIYEYAGSRTHEELNDI